MCVMITGGCLKDGITTGEQKGSSGGSFGMSMCSQGWLIVAT